MDNDYTFHGQRPEETVQLVIKQHPWVMWPIGLVWLAAIIISVGLLRWLGASAVPSYTIIGLTIIGVAFSFYRWYLWANGLYIISSQRVIKVNQLGLFNRQIAEAEISRIQEISTDIRGPIKTLLNFGTVKIQTASTTGQLDLENSPSPYDVQQLIARSRAHNSSLDATGPLSS
ncbi:MAG: PH domain-containing protein [Patescibacteria group bacterium]